MSEQLDVIVVGAGPSGLNAALVLGRARRTVLVVDSGEPRNAASHAMHGYLSRDGLDPAELRRLGRAELEAYPSISLTSASVAEVVPAATVFQVRLADGRAFTARKLLLAVGVRDEMPPIEGLAPLYGNSAFHCPYCDGWESRDQQLALIGPWPGALRLAKLLLSWSRDLVFCTNGLPGPDGEPANDLTALGIRVDERPIARLLGEGGRLLALQFGDGTELARQVVFFHGDVVLASTLPAALGCALTDAGRIEVDEGGRTSVDGVYAAGDAARRRGQHPATQVILAAASGALAGITVHQDLMAEDVGLKPALPDLRVAAT